MLKRSQIEKQTVATRKVLIVEDNEEFSFYLQKLLERLNHQVKIVSNGKEAIRVINIEDFDYILSDIRMPHLNGIDLLLAVKKFHSNIKFILMTSYMGIIDLKEAFDLGADGFLLKPFGFDDVERLLSESERENYMHISLMYPHLQNIPIDEFMNGNLIHSPVYLQLSPTKIVKISENGLDLNEEQLKRYKEKGINFLLVDFDFEKIAI